jgi:hypothetical protein
MRDRRTIDPGARADAEAPPSTPRDSVDRIASFLFVLGALLIFLAALLSTVSGFEKSLQAHFERLVNESIQVPVSPQSPAVSIHLSLIQNVENSDWVRIWGVTVDVSVKARDRRTWLYINGQPQVLRYPNRKPKTRKEIHAKLLPATATVTTSVAHDSPLFSSILTVYTAIFLAAFFVHNRIMLNRQIRAIDDARESRDQAASTARRIEKELRSVQAQLREVEPAKRQDRDEIMRLQSEQQELRAKLDQLVTRERELRGQAEEMELSGYLGKPFSVPQIIQTVQRIVTQTHEAENKESIESPVLSQVVYEYLKTLHAKTGAYCVLLLNSEGRLLRVVGQVDKNRTARLAMFIAANFLTVSKLSTLLDDDGSDFKSIYHEGSKYNIYAYDVNSAFFLAVVFGAAGKPGTVWLYTRETASALAPLLEPAAGAPTAHNDSDTSVVDEFDDLLGDMTGNSE